MTVLLARADARALPLRDGSVQCCVTSPPYWGLRDYGTPGQLGLEPTPEEYVAHMVEVFREVRRVLRDDGVLWLNLGDSYYNYRVGNKGGMPGNTVHKHERHGHPDFEIVCLRRATRQVGLKEKDLVGIPWMVAFALRSDGWYLRSDIIWAKPNPMPESVTDRPTRSHEYLFLLTKAARYYYDAEAVKERQSGNPHSPGNKTRTQPEEKGNRDPSLDPDRVWASDGSRNLRSVWTVTTQPYKGAHYATFPTKIVEPCILAGTSAKGACATCGAPWERVVEKAANPDGIMGKGNARHADDFNPDAKGVHVDPPRVLTLSWRATCTCGTESTRPCVVLDPFCGTATVARVAIAHGRRAVGFDLSGEYLSKLATRRTHNVQLEMIG
jgi:DNA modification methylase